MLSAEKDDIISHLSDLEIEKELAHDLRIRGLDQKLFYISSKKANNYYEGWSKALESLLKVGNLKKKISESEKYYSFLKKHLNKKEKSAIISLGCGNAWKEVYALSKLHKEGYKLVFIGIDTAVPMLELAQKNFENLGIEKYFIRVDMTSDDFKREIENFTKNCQKRIFAFLGSTFGNINQTDMADTLANLLKERDMLWLEVFVRPDLKAENDIKLFKHYSERLSKKNAINFLFGPLKEIGIPLSSGKLGLRVISEESVGSLLFTYYFKFNKKVVITLRNGKNHLLPSEEIDLYGIRAYHPKTLVKFFKEHEFNLVSEIPKGGDNRREQFMFKEK